MQNKIKYIPTTILTLMTLATATGLSSVAASAATEGSRNASVTVETTCTFTGGESTYDIALTGIPGTSVDTLAYDSTAKPSFSVSCNDINGFKVKAIGFSPNASSAGEGVDGNTTMYGVNGTIATGTSGSDSYWAFRTSALTASAGSTATTNYGAANTWYAIPSVLTSVADFTGVGASTVTGTVRTDYKVYTSPSQAAGTYTGKVKYYIVGNGD